MKISAIRLAEFGRFAEPVAVEHMSGGLDILAGPNELGKSTLLKALQLALFEKYSTTGKKVKDLRPYGGGSPTVEIEFETGRSRYRLRKRFLGQASAELRDLSGSQLLRGPEAETELARLVGGDSGFGRFGLAWVGQRGTLEPVSPSSLDDGLASLHRALSREVAAAATGSRAKVVHGEVRSLLGELMSHAGTRPRGAYDAVLKDLKTKSADFSKAQSDLLQTQERIERLATLRTCEAELGNATATATRAANLEAARTALETARTAQARRDVLAEALKSAEADLSQKQRAETDFSQAVADVAQCAVAVATASTSRTTHETLVDQLAAIAAAQQQRLDDLRTERETLGQCLAAARASERQQAAAAHAAELAQREHAARQLTAECQRLADTLARSPATPDRCKAATRAAADIRECEARLKAVAAVVSIAYLPGAEGRLRVAGRPLAQGEEVSASEPLIIEIAGIGSISITPGGDAALRETRAQLDKLQSDYAAILAAAGAADLATLERGLDQRRETENALADAKTRLHALAPEGLTALLTARQAAGAASAAANEAAGLAITPPGTQSDSPLGKPAAGLERGLATINTHVSEAERALAPQVRELAAGREKLAGLTAEIDALHRRQAELAARLPASDDALKAKGADLAAAVAGSRANVNRVVRDLNAWTEQAPDTANYAALQTASTTAEAASRAAGDELEKLRTEAAHLEGALAEARNEDLEMRVSALGQEIERLEADKKRFEDEVAALQLLDRELSDEEARNRDRYQAPVLARLGPYLDTIFPAAQLSFDASLAPDTLRRGLGPGSLPESLDRMSDGTQEQIAVMVRLAYARLFADTGAAVPLILDDALVYADDQRITAMFRALELAAKHHQVIVLTCRTMAFQQLQGRRLTLEPWALARAA